MNEEETPKVKLMVKNDELNTTVSVKADLIFDDEGVIIKIGLFSKLRMKGSEGIYGIPPGQQLIIDNKRGMK